MRRSGKWMTIWDDRILEIMKTDEDMVGRVKELADDKNVRISRSSVSRRCTKLEEHGLIRKVGDGVYILTDRGRAYLKGELSTFEDEPEEQLTRDDSTADTSTSTENGV